MTNNVIRLPEPALLRWGTLSKSISEGLTVAGRSDDEIQYALSQIKPIFLANPSEISIEAANKQDLVEELNRRVQKLFNALLLELVKRELDLYRLRGLARNTSPE